MLADLTEEEVYLIWTILLNLYFFYLFQGPPGAPGPIGATGPSGPMVRNQEFFMENI